MTKHLCTICSLSAICYCLYRALKLGCYLSFCNSGATAVTSNPDTTSEFGEGTGGIFLDEVDCNGTEQNLLDCPHNGLGVHSIYCYHSIDAAVRCIGNSSRSRKLLCSGISTSYNQISCSIHNDFRHAILFVSNVIVWDCVSK